MVSDVTALVGRLLLPALAVDADGRITAANEPLGNCLGLGVATLVGRALADCMIDAAALPDFLRAPAVPGEFRFRTGDGGARDLALSLVVAAPAGGAALTAFDMTAQRSAERALQEEIARYQDMTTAASDWFFELDRTMTRMRLVRRHAAGGGVTLIERRTQWPHELVDVTYDPDAFANVIRKM
ncbi:MAG TPA: PAS domain-containing protein, partial [Stellaceae bacterium]|nr:PAS domain-containing protein [Stellaceae bacterium]